MGPACPAETRRRRKHRQVRKALFFMGLAIRLKQTQVKEECGPKNQTLSCKFKLLHLFYRTSEEAALPSDNRVLHHFLMHFNWKR